AAYAKASRDVSLVEVGKALAILDGLPNAHNASDPYALAGAVYREKGDSLHNAESIEWYRKSEAVLLRGRRIQEFHYDRGRQVMEKLQQGPYVPMWTPVFEELGETWMRLAEYGKAVEAFGAAVNLNPSAARFAQLSSAYDKAGDRTQAAI